MIRSYLRPDLLTAGHGCGGGEVRRESDDKMWQFIGRKQRLGCPVGGLIAVSFVSKSN